MIEFENEKYYTVPEVAEILSCSDRTVRRYEKAGKLEGRYITSRLYITEGSIKRHIEGNGKKALKVK